MNTNHPNPHRTHRLLAAALAFGLLPAACDRRTVEDDSAATPAEPASSGEAVVPPPVTDVDSGAATPAPSAGTPATAGPASAAATTSQADALALLIAVNEHEIAAADQAQTKQVTGPVLAFAQMMKSDHEKNLADTTRLGGAESTAPAISALRSKGEADLKTLATQSGGAYERAYMDAMVRGHGEALALIDGTLLPAATADNVRKHFTTTRAEVAHHLERAKEIQAGLK
ncbi:DUF4142 domain-containing protein [Lysobacter niabensis]|uniref:DUF4142 domain-containing protein n=1 Tax=Agrilutibacter niabensis TaxID=380628 RepID=UPI00360D5B8B